MWRGRLGRIAELLWISQIGRLLLSGSARTFCTMLRVTVDSTVLDRHMARLEAAAEGSEVEILPTTVTLREHGKRLPSPDPFVPETSVYDESAYDSGAVYAASLPVVFETMVFGESGFGMAAFGAEESPSMLEIILRVIGAGSFPPPGKREALNQGQRHQLRDAMILEAHSRDGRDVLVSDDRRAFIGKDGARRRTLEAFCTTKIRTVDEFCTEIATLAHLRGRAKLD
jgi:hypothetical protein